MGNVLLFGGSSGTTGSAGQLHGADNGVLGVHQFEFVEVEVANLHRLAKAEIIDIDYEAFGDIGIDSLNFQFLHREREFTTGLDTFGVAFEEHGNLDNDGLGVVDFEEVDVEDVILHGVELDVLEDSHALFAVDAEVDGKDIGRIDEFADSVGADNEVGSDEALVVADFNEFFAGEKSLVVGQFNNSAAVEDNGDKAFFAEGLCSLLTEVGTRRSRKFKFFHFQIIKCVTQN